MRFSPTRRQAGWWAIVSGVAGLAAFAFLVAALAAPTPSATTLRRYPDLFRWQDAGVLLQALAMIPVTLGLHALMRRQKPDRRRLAAGVGIFAQLALVAILVLRFANVTSDMLYMLPQGLVGLWLLAINWGSPPPVTRGLGRLGIVAGLGLSVVGVGFLLYGALVAPKVFLGPLTDAEIDTQTWTAANTLAHICLAVGAITGRSVYPIWAILLGRSLLSSRLDLDRGEEIPTSA